MYDNYVVCKVTNNILIVKGFAVPGEGCIKVVAGCRRIGEKRVADAEVVNSLIYKRVEIKSVQASYIFYVCKWLIHCDLIHYKPHLPN